MTRPADDLDGGRQLRPVVWPSEADGHFASLLFREAMSAGVASDQDTDRSFAPDLNLDQIVAAITGDREERDLITKVLFGHLHDADAVRYRHEVFRDLDDAALFEEVQRFADHVGQVRVHLRQLAKMPHRYHQEGWLLDAAAIYCEAVQSLAAHLASAPISSRALLAFREYLASYVASARFTALVSDTRNRKDALGQIRYCTRIRAGRVEVSRYQDEADYSAIVLKTFERFKQGAVKDYTNHYRARPGMNHVTAQILELVARLFPEEFTALDEYCRQHAAFLDEGIRHADRELQFYLAYLDYVSRFALPGCASAIPRSPPQRKFSPPIPSTWPWRTSSSTSTSRWSPTSSAWQAPSGSSS